MPEMARKLVENEFLTPPPKKIYKKINGGQHFVGQKWEEKKSFS